MRGKSKLLILSWIIFGICHSIYMLKYSNQINTKRYERYKGWNANQIAVLAIVSPGWDKGATMRLDDVTVPWIIHTESITCGRRERKSQGGEIFARPSWKTQGNSWLGCGMNERESKKDLHSLCISWAKMWRYRVMKSVDELKPVVSSMFSMTHATPGLTDTDFSQRLKMRSFSLFHPSSHGSGPCPSPVLVEMGLTAGPYPFERGFFKQFLDDHGGKVI